MKTLYLDIFSGISGDMFIGALLDLGVDLRQLEHELARLQLDGYHLHAERKRKSSIEGVKFDVHLAHEHHHHDEPGHAHAHQDHEHSHDGAHAHHGEDRGERGGPLAPTLLGQVELSVFEKNVPPRFRLFFLDAQGRNAKPPAAQTVTLETIRSDKARQTFKFAKHDKYLEATTHLPEPHEFTAVLKLKRGSRTERCKIQFVEDHHHHDHEHSHAHDERNFADIQKLIQESTLSDWVKQKAVAVFHRVAVAEGKIHGHPPEEVHFHEVGAIDSIVDIVGACIALELLGKPRVLAAPVVEGTGWVNCAHGCFPVPTTATLEILGARGIALTQCDEPHELVTPTGAALLAEFAESFAPMRDLAATKIGYGLGTRDNQTRPNVLRAVLGEARAADTNHDWETDTIAVLETNLDDLSPEILGHFIAKALAAGALDVFHTPIQMKKNRPGVLLTVLCAVETADLFTEMILCETSAFGVRRSTAERRKLQREFIVVKTPHGEISVKLGKLDGRIVQAAPEFESCHKLAEQTGVPLKEIYQAARRAL